LLHSDCSDLMSNWRGHTVATTFLLRGHCQTCAGCPETIFCFNRTAPRRIKTRCRRFPGARDARNATSSKRFCPCTQGTFRAWILTILSPYVITTNTLLNEPYFNLLSANSVVRYFVANNTFQRYVTIENIWVSQGKTVTWVRLGGKYLYGIQFQPLCHLPTKIY